MIQDARIPLLIRHFDIMDQLEASERQTQRLLACLKKNAQELDDLSRQTSDFLVHRMVNFSTHFHAGRENTTEKTRGFGFAKSS